MALTRRDYGAVVFIGACFGLFSIPILRTVNISFLPIGWGTGAALVVFFSFFAALALAAAGLVARYIPVVLQIAKFSAVGAFNTFLDWGTLNLVMLFFAQASGGGWYAAAKGFSFIVANVGSYVWNKYWTFEAGGRGRVGREVASFIVVSLIGLAINIGVAVWVQNAIPISSFFTAGRIANLGAASATVVSLVWNFVGYKFFVFSPQS